MKREPVKVTLRRTLLLEPVIFVGYKIHVHTRPLLIEENILEIDVATVDNAVKLGYVCNAYAVEFIFVRYAFKLCLGISLIVEQIIDVGTDNS